ncbi:hypothetical protein HYS48_00480 [Candidatus Woesearchaeota archaeon]|nr:hypothetical protein [Candidatus Woesearchaeota archaeon]
MPREEIGRVVRKAAGGRILEVRHERGGTSLVNLDSLGIDPMDVQIGEEIRVEKDFLGKIKKLRQYK